MIRGDFVKLIEKDLKTDQDEEEDVIFKEIETDFENQEMKQLEEEIQAEIESYVEKTESIPKPKLSNEILQLHARLNLTDPGHLGTGVELPQILDFDIEEKLNNSYRAYQINEFVSSLVPLDRELLDIRSDYCKQMNYSQNLPMASIILVSHNEAISMILRTIYSILNRSPENLIREIILIDDCSTLGIEKLLKFIFGFFS